MSNRVVHALVPLALLLPTGLCAQSYPPSRPQTQNPTPTTPHAATPLTTIEAVDQQVQEMRRQLVEGRKFRSHVRVTVRLNNGNVIRGVVKDSQLVERVDGLRFVAAEANHPAAGMRVYYWNGTGSYVFVPFADMRDYRINERLTPAQLRTIEQENRARDEKSQLDHEQAVAQAEAEAAALAAAAAESGTEQPTEPTGGKPKGDAKSGDPAAKGAGKAPPKPGELSEEQKKLYALVQEYPPQAGWSEQKRDEIARRRAVIGANPSDAEKRFVENFADWQKACDLFGLKPSTPAPTGESSNAESSSRG